MGHRPCMTETFVGTLLGGNMMVYVSSWSRLSAKNFFWNCIIQVDFLFMESVMTWWYGIILFWIQILASSFRNLLGAVLLTFITLQFSISKRGAYSADLMYWVWKSLWDNNVKLLSTMTYSKCWIHVIHYNCFEKYFHKITCQCL